MVLPEGTDASVLPVTFSANVSGYDIYLVDSDHSFDTGDINEG